MCPRSQGHTESLAAPSTTPSVSVSALGQLPSPSAQEFVSGFPPSAAPVASRDHPAAPSDNGERLTNEDGEAAENARDYG
ncbi:hypothetical protein D9615_010308 [Tricholomella constricta]|uniref:Uncharacterized protein n=1 Tax=Tricholomella constricta TaxID=117010 RepID=A0A8H5GP98_9AGAR|nr:hypothetical protein D9615_010308 [Tricholomella constricta]